MGAAAAAETDVAPDLAVLDGSAPETATDLEGGAGGDVGAVGERGLGHAIRGLDQDADAVGGRLDAAAGHGHARRRSGSEGSRVDAGAVAGHRHSAGVGDRRGAERGRGDDPRRADPVVRPFRTDVRGEFAAGERVRGMGGDAARVDGRGPAGPARPHPHPPAQGAVGLDHAACRVGRRDGPGGGPGRDTVRAQLVAVGLFVDAPSGDDRTGVRRRHGAGVRPGPHAVGTGPGRRNGAPVRSLRASRVAPVFRPHAVGKYAPGADLAAGLVDRPRRTAPGDGDEAVGDIHDSLEVERVAGRGDRAAVDRRRRRSPARIGSNAIGSISPSRDGGAGLVRTLRVAAGRPCLHAASRQPPRRKLRPFALGDDGAEIARADDLVGVSILRDDVDSPTASGHVDVGPGVHEQVVAQGPRTAGAAGGIPRAVAPHGAQVDEAGRDHPRVLVREAELREVEIDGNAVEIEDEPQIGAHDDRVRAGRVPRAIEVVQRDQVARLAAAGHAVVGIGVRRPRSEDAAAQGAPLERVARHGGERRPGCEQRHRGKQGKLGSGIHHEAP